MSHYGATLADLEAWVPNITFDATSHPTQAQVENFITIADNDVYFALGTLPNINPADQADLYGSILAQAKAIVAMRAAADAYNVHFPERATDKQEYGNQLRAQYVTALANLASVAQRGTDLGDGLVVPSVGPVMATPGQGWRAPLPLFVTRLEPGSDLVNEGDLSTLTADGALL